MFAAWYVPAGEWTGSVGAGVRAFPESPAWDEQTAIYPSLRLDARYTHHWPESDSGVVLDLFGRASLADDGTSHIDLREAYWYKRGAKWEVRLGLVQAQWGSLLSKRVADFLGQTDQLEGFAGGGHLGQPMAGSSWYADWGTLHTYVMPGFRPREFTKESGRPSIPIAFNEGDARYANPNEEWGTDFALRYEKHSAQWDFGLTQFYGTVRQPTFIPEWRNVSFDSLTSTRELTGNRLLEFASQLDITLVPYYDRAHITAFDVQHARGAALYKLEGYFQFGEEERRYAASAGIEYAFGPVFNTQHDLTAILEYHHEAVDNRRRLGLLDNTVFVGGRLALGTEQPTSVQAGGLFNLHNATTLLNFGLTRALTDDLEFTVGANLFVNAPAGEAFYYFRKDSALRMELVWYF